MTAEEQLIHDILVLEERKIFLNTLNQEIKLAQREDRDKLTLRQIKAINEYAKEQAVEFAKSITLIDEFVMPRQAVMLAAHFKWDELYDQFKQQ